MHDGLLRIVLLLLPVGSLDGDAVLCRERAVPLIQVILFFLNRNSTPLEFCVLTPRERFIATP